MMPDVDVDVNIGDIGSDSGGSGGSNDFLKDPGIWRIRGSDGSDSEKSRL